jgi:hypothetical protein
VPVGGHSPTRGQQGWPNPWLARLDDDATQARDGFDPQVHGFGFGNWAGKTGVRKNGELFTLPYTETPGEDAVNWIQGLDDPIARGEDLWEGGVELAEGLYRRQISTDGHCLGMVLSADHYFQSPAELPRGVQFAQSVPHPTGRYESVGERIRSEQDSFGHGRTATQVVLALNAPLYEPKPNYEKIRRSVSNTGTAPVALELKPEDSRSGKPKQGSEKIFHSGLVYHWEETGDAVELYYYDPDDPAENYRSPDEVYGTELDEEDSHLDRAFEKPRHSLRINPETGELLDNTHPRGFSVVTYAYFPVGRGAAVADTFEAQTDRGTQRSEYRETRSDPQSASVSARGESGGVEVEYLDHSTEHTPDRSAESNIESVERPDIALPSLLESAVIATLCVPGQLIMRTSDGREITSDDSEYVYKDATEYSEMVWAVGLDPGEVSIDVNPETAGAYTLRVSGNVAEGGQIDERVESAVSEDSVHNIEVNLPEEGSGSVTVSTPAESTGEDDSGEVRSAEGKQSDHWTTGTNSPEFGTEVLAALGIIALVASGYLTLTGRV